MSASGGRKAIIAAAGANLGIALAKFVGFLITGASSMLAEAIHSLVDTANQGLLLLGQAKARHEATPDHPFGFGRQRYFYAFLVGLMLFTAGGMFSIYEGIHKLNHPEPIEDAIVAVVILAVAVALESFSLRTALAESRPLRQGISLWQFIRRAKAPELPVVVLEDTAALVGLLFALLAVVASWATGDPTYDAVGTIAIGVLLICVAVILVLETHSLLVGEGVTPEAAARIVRAIEGGPDDAIDRVIHVKTLFLGPDEVLVAAKVAISPGAGAVDVARAIDAAEGRLRAVSPVELAIFLEPDIDVSQAREGGGQGQQEGGGHGEQGRHARHGYEGRREEVLQDEALQDESQS